MGFAELIDQNLLTLDLPGGDKFEVIEALLDLAMKSGKIQNRQLALSDLVERERYLSTGYENGLAVPHAKSASVSEMVLAVGRSSAGVEFDSLDGKPTHFVFLLLSPVDTSGPHIQALAMLARNFQDAQTVARLMNCSTAQQLSDVLMEFK